MATKFFTDINEWKDSSLTSGVKQMIINHKHMFKLFVFPIF